MNGVVLKLGGAASLAGQLDVLIGEVASLDSKVLLIHGGGAEVSALSTRLGIEPIFVNGIRMTTDEEIDVVEMVLSGLVNKRIVRRFAAAGVQAVGISGADASIVTAEPIKDESGRPTRTARVATINTDLIEHLWAAGYVPVLSSPGSDNESRAVNVNADDVAFAIAQALKADALVFLSDVPGVLVDESPVRRLTPREVEKLIAGSHITGGMVPKVGNAVTAVRGGVNRVVIGMYGSDGDLGKLLAEELGTSIEGDRS
jgi:acetylglutamate kinase